MFNTDEFIGNSIESTMIIIGLANNKLDFNDYQDIYSKDRYENLVVGIIGQDDFSNLYLESTKEERIKLIKLILSKLDDWKEDFEKIIDADSYIQEKVNNNTERINAIEDKLAESEIDNGIRTKEVYNDRT